MLLKQRKPCLSMTCPSTQKDPRPGQDLAKGRSWQLAALAPSLRPDNPGMTAARPQALWGEGNQHQAAGARTHGQGQLHGHSPAGGGGQTPDPDTFPLPYRGGGHSAERTEDLRPQVWLSPLSPLCRVKGSPKSWDSSPSIRRPLTFSGHNNNLSSSFRVGAQLQLYTPTVTGEGAFRGRAHHLLRGPVQFSAISVRESCFLATFLWVTFGYNMKQSCPKTRKATWVVVSFCHKWHGCKSAQGLPGRGFKCYMGRLH